MSRTSADPDTATTVRLPAEEMPLGVEIDCGSQTITEQEIIEFGTLWDPQYFHIDPDAAAHSTFGGVIASDVLTGTVVLRSVEPARRGRCLVTIIGTLRNQDGVPVLDLEVDSLVRSRTPSEDSAGLWGPCCLLATFDPAEHGH